MTMMMIRWMRLEEGEGLKFGVENSTREGILWEESGQVEDKVGEQVGMGQTRMPRGRLLQSVVQQYGKNG
jgi:hypothetical protein